MSEGQTKVSSTIRKDNPVLDAIFNRRSVRKVRQDEEPSRELIELLLEAATWAPNHYVTEPWRFVVLRGEARNELGEAMAHSLLAQNDDIADFQKKFELEKVKPLRAPVLIVLIYSPKMGGKDDKIMAQEEIVAAGAAMQNLLLAAYSLGLAAMVRTGHTVYSPEVSSFLKLRENESVIGVIYIGYPAEDPGESKRSGFKDKTSWLGFD